MNVLITGGSSGLGEAIVRNLATDLNFNVYFTYSNSSDNAAKIERENANTKAIRCDFRNTKEVEDLKSKIPAMDIDVLINNAYTGEVFKSHFHKISPEDLLTDFQNNIIPTVILTQAAIELFRKKRSGRIITVLTSALLNTAPAGTSVYVANKAYLEKLTKVWASENIKFNITSNSISPAFMLTNLTKDTDQRVLDQILSNHPLKRLLTCEEVAESVNFLIKATPHINGVDIVINAASNIK